MNIDKIPSEVTWAMAIQWTRQPVGLDTWNEIQAIIDRNPEYFPWEHKYKSIPKQVHEAYHKEANPNWGKSFKEMFEQSPDEGYFKGVIPAIMESSETAKESPPVTQLSIKEMLTGMLKQEDERRKQGIDSEKENKRIWDKHYKKYDLKYRP